MKLKIFLFLVTLKQTNVSQQEKAIIIQVPFRRNAKVRV